MKTLQQFSEGKKAPEASRQKLTKYGWERGTDHPDSPTHTYSHPEHPGHLIHHNPKTGGFQHVIHHSYDLEKHLSQHDRDHEGLLEPRTGAKFTEYWGYRGGPNIPEYWGYRPRR